MATLLMPLPDSDFDPTESGVPWRTMSDHGHNVVFATPSGRTARADPKMVTERHPLAASEDRCQRVGRVPLHRAK
jgi:hypothetical protein